MRADRAIDSIKFTPGTCGRETFGLTSLLAKTFRRSPQRVIIGGIDLSQVDVRIPFRVDFSVGPNAPVSERQRALKRMNLAMRELARAIPFLWFESQASVKNGQAVLVAIPTVPNQQNPKDLTP